MDTLTSSLKDSALQDAILSIIVRAPFVGHLFDLPSGDQAEALRCFEAIKSLEHRPTAAVGGDAQRAAVDWFAHDAVPRKAVGTACSKGVYGGAPEGPNRPSGGKKERRQTSPIAAPQPKRTRMAEDWMA